MKGNTGMGWDERFQATQMPGDMLMSMDYVGFLGHLVDSGILHLIPSE